MSHSFALLRLLGTQMAQLEKLRQLELKLSEVEPSEAHTINGDIEEIVEQITQSNRVIRDLKASHLLSLQD